MDAERAPDLQPRTANTENGPAKTKGISSPLMSWQMGEEERATPTMSDGDHVSMSPCLKDPSGYRHKSVSAATRNDLSLHSVSTLRLYNISSRSQRDCPGSEANSTCLAISDLGVSMSIASIRWLVRSPKRPVPFPATSKHGHFLSQAVWVKWPVLYPA